jgi:cytoskeletal protein CcmA (bactofilin family)
MGWFDQEVKKTEAEPSAAPPAAPVRPAASARPGQGAPSTVGPKVHINGTLIVEEDLEIVGKIDGTINARAGLHIAKAADVKAVINGTKVLIEGTVHGDVNATETVVLGASASLTGNVKTPSLQIREGAFFRGQVTMQAASEVSAPRQASAAKQDEPAGRSASESSKVTGSSSGGDSGPGGSDGGAGRSPDPTPAAVSKN